MKLYSNPRSRGVRVQWTLDELDLPYEYVHVDIQPGGSKDPEYLKVHPFGQVPALVTDDGQTLIESGAICCYLAALKPEKNLGPGDQPGEYYQWCFYTFGSLEGPLMDTFMHTAWLPEEQRSAAVAERAGASLKRVLTHLNEHMKGRKHLLGERFSVADILLGGTLGWAASIQPLTDYPNLVEYVDRIQARPAFTKIAQAMATK